MLLYLFMASLYTYLTVLMLTMAPLSEYDKVNLIIENTIAHEGGWSDHPSDPGGKTKYGITLRTAKVWWGQQFTADNLRAMSMNEAKQGYKEHVFYKNKLNLFPDKIWDVLFDMHVNHGSANANKILQKALVRLGQNITVDGVAGSGTMEAVKQVDDRLLREALISQRMVFYSAIVTAKPEQKVFLAGWISRCSRFVTDPKLCN